MRVRNTGIEAGSYMAFDNRFFKLLRDTHFQLSKEFY